MSSLCTSVYLLNHPLDLAHPLVHQFLCHLFHPQGLDLQVLLEYLILPSNNTYYAKQLVVSTTSSNLQLVQQLHLLLHLHGHQQHPGSIIMVTAAIMLFTTHCFSRGSRLARLPISSRVTLAIEMKVINTLCTLTVTLTGFPGAPGDPGIPGGPVEP